MSWSELRRLGRATLLALYLVLAVALALLVLPTPGWLKARYVPGLGAWWLRRGLAILGVTVVVRGQAARGLLVANHISWLDILVIAAGSDASFVAKAEVGAWPLIGWLAGIGGTEFVRRGSHADYRRVLERMGRRLKEGESLTLFPEGTSHGTVLPGRFRPRLLQAAVDAHVPVQPVAIYYGSAPELLRRVAFIGDDAFLTHLWRLLGADPVLAEVSYLPPLSSISGDLRLMADEAWHAVSHALTRLELFELEARHAASVAVPYTVELTHTA